MAGQDGFVARVSARRTRSSSRPSASVTETRMVTRWTSDNACSNPVHAMIHVNGIREPILTRMNAVP